MHHGGGLLRIDSSLPGDSFQSRDEIVVSSRLHPEYALPGRSGFTWGSLVPGDTDVVIVPLIQSKERADAGDGGSKSSLGSAGMRDLPDSRRWDGVPLAALDEHQLATAQHYFHAMLRFYGESSALVRQAVFAAAWLALTGCYVGQSQSQCNIKKE